MTTTTTVGPTVYPTWKPSPRHAAMMEQPPTPPPPTVTTVTHEWGFGARGATKLWTPPATPPVPTDWWKK